MLSSLLDFVSQFLRTWPPKGIMLAVAEVSLEGIVEVCDPEAVELRRTDDEKADRPIVCTLESARGEQILLGLDARSAIEPVQVHGKSKYILHKSFKIHPSD